MAHMEPCNKHTGETQESVRGHQHASHQRGTRSWKASHVKNQALTPQAYSDLTIRLGCIVSLPGPCPAFRRLQYGKAGRAWDNYHMCDIRVERRVERQICSTKLSHLAFDRPNAATAIDGSCTLAVSAKSKCRERFAKASLWCLNRPVFSEAIAGQSGFTYSKRKLNGHLDVSGSSWCDSRIFGHG